VETLAGGPKTVSDLAAPVAMKLPSFMQHLRLLEASGIVVTSKSGRIRTCWLDPTALDEVERWVGQRRRSWVDRLDGLETFLSQANEGAKRKPK